MSPSPRSIPWDSVSNPIITTTSSPQPCSWCLVRFDKRAHNPILREAALDRDCPPVPWLGGLRVAFEYP